MFIFAVARMNVGLFYGTRSLIRKVTTLADVGNEVVQSVRVLSAVVLPLDVGDAYAESDVEDVPK